VSGAAVIFGAPGAGKTTVLERTADRLEAEQVTFGALESEQLAWGFPLLAFDRIVEQTAAVLQLQRRGGRRLFLLAVTVEGAAELGSFCSAIPARPLLTVALDARPQTCAARIEAREPESWTGRAELVRRARTIAQAVTQIDAQLRIDTELVDPETAARRVVQALRAAGALKPHDGG